MLVHASGVWHRFQSKACLHSLFWQVPVSHYIEQKAKGEACWSFCLGFLVRQSVFIAGFKRPTPKTNFENSVGGHLTNSGKSGGRRGKRHFRRSLWRASCSGHCLPERRGWSAARPGRGPAGPGVPAGRSDPRQLLSRQTELCLWRRASWDWGWPWRTEGRASSERARGGRRHGLGEQRKRVFPRWEACDGGLKNSSFLLSSLRPSSWKWAGCLKAGASGRRWRRPLTWSGKALGLRHKGVRSWQLSTHVSEVTWSWHRSFLNTFIQRIFIWCLSWACLKDGKLNDMAQSRSKPDTKILFLVFDGDAQPVPWIYSLKWIINKI